MQPFYAPDFEVKIQGLTMEADVKNAVIDLKYDNNLEQADMFQLNLNNADLRFTDSPLFHVGKDVEIYMGYVDELKPMMLGEIVSIQPSFPSGGAPTISITGYDKSHRMRHNNPGRFTFNYLNDSMIAAQIATENLLIPVVDPAPMTPDEATPQTGSDWSLLKELADRNFFQVYVHWDKLYFRFPRPQTEKIVLEWGKNLSSFSPRLSTSGQFGIQVIRGYDYKLAQTIVSILPAVSLGADLGDLTEKLGDDFIDQLVQLGRNVIRDRPVENFMDATVLAKTILQQLLQGLYEGTGACIGIPKLRAGDVVEITGIGKRFSGNYTLNKVTHTINQSGYQTQFEVTQKYSSSLLQILRNKISDNPSPNKRDKVNGVVIGFVENNVDPEGLGRIQLSFPHLSDINISKFARVVTPMAGSDRGIYFLPDKDDEVLVAFDHGDVSKPIIIGSLWNGKARPPELNTDGQNNRRLIKTKSGHTIMLDDTSGQENLVLEDKAGSNIKMDSSTGDIIIEAKGNVIINNGNKGVARQDDSVEVTIPASTFIVAVSGGSGAAAVGTPNPNPIKVQGKITSASSTVKSGN